MSQWTVVLPLKGGAAAKSRLRGEPGLAAAIALDTVEAVLAAVTVRAVLVVTPDAELVGAARALGAGVVPEPAPSGLDAAIRAGIAAACGPTAVLLGDLPALRSEDLDAALASCRHHAVAFVPDANGSGTVLLAARRPADLAPRFGIASADRHAASGAVRLDLDLPRLRRDVDTPADLIAASDLGLGPRTAGVTRAQRRSRTGRRE